MFDFTYYICIYIQRAIVRKYGKKEAKGKNIGKTHSEIDTSNNLF